MPFIQRIVEPKYLSRTTLWDNDGKPIINDDELTAVTNSTLANALRQLASLVLVANDIFQDLNGHLQKINDRSEKLKVKISIVDDKVKQYDPKKVPVPESDICTFAQFKKHHVSKHEPDTNLFNAETRPTSVQILYQAATKTPVHLMRQMDRWRRDGHRSSRFFLCTPVLGAKRRKLKNKINIDIETRLPAAVEELRRWTSSEALGDITVNAECPFRINTNISSSNNDEYNNHLTDGTIISDDEGIDHKLPSPEEQLKVVALKFPAEIVYVDVSGRNFDRMSFQRRSLLNNNFNQTDTDGSMLRRKTKTRRPRNRRRNTLAGTDQKEIRDALTVGDEEDLSSLAPLNEPESSSKNGAVSRSKSSDLLRSSNNKKESPEPKKSHFNSLKQWGKNRLKMIMPESKTTDNNNTKSNDIDDMINIYETVTMKRKRSVEREKKMQHERKPSCSSSEKSSINVPVSNSSVMDIAVKLRDSSVQRRLRRTGGNKDEPHSSSGNWSASSESGRASIGSEITTTTQPKSTTSATTSSNSLHPPSSVNSRRRYNINTSASGSVTSEGTLTPDIIHDLHEDGETSSVYSCDTEGYYTSFHMDSGLKTLKEEDTPVTPMHSSYAISQSDSNTTVLSPENEYELFGKGSTSTTTSSAGTVCTTLRAGGSNRSLSIGPAVPERKSSLSKLSNKSAESSLERDADSDKTGTVKRSPANHKATVVAMIHKQHEKGDISPDSGHNTSSSPIESINSPNGVRSGSEFEFSESSDMEGPDRIERIRMKTAINSSRIPSMCVITPQHSDDESVKSNNFDSVQHKNSINMISDNKTENNNNNLHVPEIGSNNMNRSKLELHLKSQEFDPDIIKSTEDKSNINPKIVVTPVNGSNKLQLINVNPQSGYATVETINIEMKMENKEDVSPKTANTTTVSKNIRAPSPSGGTVTIKGTSPKPIQTQPIFKASLLPLNNMFGKLKTNISNFAHRRERSKSPNKIVMPPEEVASDPGEYVTIADVRNNNEKAYPNDVNRNLKSVLSGKVRETEYVSLNELPCNDPEGNSQSPINSLERKKRQGARVTLDADGKVIYSSDSLKRKKGAHTTFEPGPYVKKNTSPSASPLPEHRTLKTIRPVTGQDATDSCRSLSPQLGKFVIRASSRMSTASEIVRMPPSTIVTPSVRPMSPKPTNSRGAYVHIQESLPLKKDEERALSPSHQRTAIYSNNPSNNMNVYPRSYEVYNEVDNDESMLGYNQKYRNYHPPQHHQHHQMGVSRYSTLPVRKSQQHTIIDSYPERSVTPDITRGLESNQYGTNTSKYVGSDDTYKYHNDRPIEKSSDIKSKYYPSYTKYNNGKFNSKLTQNLGIPVQIPTILNKSSVQVPSQYNTERINYVPQPEPSSSSSLSRKQDRNYKENRIIEESFKISPIDPRNCGSFHSSTPSSKTSDLKAASNLENKLLSPKKSTMSNDELYAIIHKNKKKMNIKTEDAELSSSNCSINLQQDGDDNTSKSTGLKSPETGYLGEKSRSRSSWSPSSGEYVDFNTNIDKSPPNVEARTRQSWSCNDRKGVQQTSRLDFKRLLLQHGRTNNISPNSKKISAVEQLKLSKQQIQHNQKGEPDMSILELSGSPKLLGNRKIIPVAPGSPRNSAGNTSEKVIRPVPKLLSPRSQWRFANPRSDVLSSTIVEDCREEENDSNNKIEKENFPKNNSKSTNFNSKTLSNVRKQIFTDNNVQKVSIDNNVNDNNKLSITQRIKAQREQFFNNSPTASNSGNDRFNKFNTINTSNNIKENDKKQSKSPPTLETAF